MVSIVRMVELYVEFMNTKQGFAFIFSDGIEPVMVKYIHHQRRFNVENDFIQFLNRELESGYI